MFRLVGVLFRLCGSVRGPSRPPDPIASHPGVAIASGTGCLGGVSGGHVPVLQGPDRHGNHRSGAARFVMSRTPNAGTAALNASPNDQSQLADILCRSM